MKVARKLLVTGTASLVLAGGIIAFPAAVPANATHGSSGHHGPSKHHDDSYVLKEESNASYAVKTKISPRNHTLYSVVTNKTANPISPTVTFNGQNVTSHDNTPIQPGESKKYVYYFTGNNKTVDITIVTPDIDPFTSSVNIALQEPVTYLATSTDTANKTVTGTLTNNTTESQTVYINHHKNKKHEQSPLTETLAPNETRTITVAAPSYDGKRSGHDHDDKQIKISLATKAGFNSSYKVLLIPPVSGYPL